MITFTPVLRDTGADAPTIVGYEVFVPLGEFPDFKKLVQRGANLWPDASAHVKSLADRVTTGYEVQPYYSMSGEKK